jgi:hypothetical protein
MEVRRLHVAAIGSRLRQSVTGARKDGRGRSFRARGPARLSARAFQQTRFIGSKIAKAVAMRRT